MRGSKRFFFEKNKQKTFCPVAGGNVRDRSCTGAVASTANRAKVFWSFFSKKDCLLPLLICSALLTACSDDTPPVVQTLAPLQYGYLSKLRLNVGAIQVQDHSLPVGPQDVASSAPVIPAQALAQMARDRLFAAGTEGEADFVIDQASIIRGPGGGLSGRLSVHIDLLNTAGTRGFAEANVERQYVPGSEAENGTLGLYNLTKQMMDAMNVELEFQVRRSLASWLVTPGSVPAAVVAQPLDSTGTPPPVPAPPPLPPAAPQDQAVSPVPAAPDQDGYVDPAAPPPPVQMSPPPGFLQAPPAALPPVQ